MTRFVWGIVLLPLLLLGAARESHAAESYDNCKGFITSLPVVISTQGTWCLKQDLATAITSGVAITINTDNVIVDCNNFKLGGLAAGTGTQMTGIGANNHFNTMVRHCNVRGFEYGVYLGGASGGSHAVEDNRFDSNTYQAIHVEGDNSVVRRNRVFATGGTTVAGLPDAWGIVTNYSVDILDNTVSGVAATTSGGGYAYGIVTFASAPPTARIIGNGVRGIVKDGAGKARGIWNNGAGRFTLRNNDVVGDGSINSVGLLCFNSNGRAKDNLSSGFETATANCGDAGGNSVIP